VTAHAKRPTDVNELAKQLVDEATGEAARSVPVKRGSHAKTRAVKREAEISK